VYRAAIIRIPFDELTEGGGRQAAARVRVEQGAVRVAAGRGGGEGAMQSLSINGPESDLESTNAMRTKVEWRYFHMLLRQQVKPSVARKCIMTFENTRLFCLLLRLP
jgi:hypothetical protein